MAKQNQFDAASLGFLTALVLLLGSDNISCYTIVVILSYFKKTDVI